jgi:malate permease and related proteins
MIPLLETVFPVFLIFLTGYIVQKKFNLDIKSISNMSLYILSPALIFETFYTARLNGQFFYMVIIQLLLLLALIVTTKMACRLFRYDIRTESALMLTTAFMNSGNYGAPIILFAFGNKGFHEAVLIMVLHSIFMGIFAVYFASRGKASVKDAILNIFRIPNIYAVAVGLLFQYCHVPLPGSFMQAVDLVGKASIPVVMLVLGMQLATVTVQDLDSKLVSLGTIIRLIISPLLAWGICSLFPISLLSKQVMLVLAGMPSAATALLYAVQFDAKAKLVSSITLVSTILSFLSITILLTMTE